MKKIATLFLLFALTHQGFSQKETNNWTFGVKAGLTWNTTRSADAIGINTPNATLEGLPTVIPDISINTTEGCFTLSDYNGMLLFYSDGITVWDRTNTPMPTGRGLTGDGSSAQSGIILPNPGHPNQFAAVTINQLSNNRLAYSIIDMELNGGKGDVVSTKKNIYLTGGSGTMGETVTSVLHANGTDYWIATIGRGTSTYLNAWKLTSAGVEAPSAPIITPVPGQQIATGINGYMKFTADAKHFAVACFLSNRILYGDFDNNTGKFSNIRVITGQGWTQPYGLEFSKSMNYLYVGCTSKLAAFDFNALLATSNPATVPPLLYPYGSENRAPQMGPDGRIYLSGSNVNYLYVIDNPEEYTDLKIYKLPDGFLGSGRCLEGLPSFSGSWFIPPPPFCYQPPQTTGTTEPFKTIVSTLDRTAVPRNWSDERAGSLILESKSRGLVLTRIASPETAIANPVEGMIVFDTAYKILKLYNGTVWKILEQSCPN